MNYSTVLVAPTLILSQDFTPLVAGERRIRPELVSLISGKRSPLAKGIDKSIVASALENYIRRLLACCAHRICIPSHDGTHWANPRRFKSFLSPSAKKRVQFVDRRHGFWRTLFHYLAPVRDDISKSNDNSHDAAKLFQTVAWHIYLLILATRNQSETTLDPVSATADIDQLLLFSGMSAESKARLAIVRGLFAQYSQREDIPGFSVVASKGHSFTQRVDEILEDAYLLEASSLRRFLGLGSNIASLKRDLRKLTQFIVKSRPWAKGVLAATTQTGYLPKGADSVLGQLLAVAPELRSDLSAPTLVLPDAVTLGAKGHMMSAQRDAFSLQGWSSHIQPIGLDASEWEGMLADWYRSLSKDGTSTSE